MNQVVADTCGAALLPVARDAVPDPSEASQLLNVDVDQVARRLALRSAAPQAWAPDCAASQIPGGSGLWPRWRREQQAAWRCGAALAVGGGAPRRAGGDSDRSSAAVCGEHCVNPPRQPRHLSGTGPATCRRSAC